MWARLFNAQGFIRKGAARINFSQISQLRNRACTLTSCLECLHHCFDSALGYGPDSIPVCELLELLMGVYSFRFTQLLGGGGGGGGGRGARELLVNECTIVIRCA